MQTTSSFEDIMDPNGEALRAGICAGTDSEHRSQVTHPLAGVWRETARGLALRLKSQLGLTGDNIWQKEALPPVAQRFTKAQRRLFRSVIGFLEASAESMANITAGNSDSRISTRLKEIAENTLKNKPRRSGLSWSEEEEERLIQQFQLGKEISEIAIEFERSRSAISARLVLLGLLEEAHAPRFRYPTDTTDSDRSRFARMQVETDDVREDALGQDGPVL